MEVKIQGMDIRTTSAVLTHRLGSITTNPVCVLDRLESHLSDNKCGQVIMNERIADSEADPESTLHIVSKPWESFKEDVLAAAERFDDGGEAGPDTLSFSEPEEIVRILTEKRLELIRSVMEEPPDSIRDLADRLGRNPREVHGDVHLLEEYGVLDLEEAGRAKRPMIPYDEIVIEVSLKPSDESDREEVELAP